jgi:hypothetical protein
MRVLREYNVLRRNLCQYQFEIFTVRSNTSNLLDNSMLNKYTYYMPIDLPQHELQPIRYPS